MEVGDFNFGRLIHHSDSDVIVTGKAQSNKVQEEETRVGQIGEAKDRKITIRKNPGRPKPLN